MTEQQTLVTIPGLDTLPLEQLFEYEFVTERLRPAVDAALRSRGGANRRLPSGLGDSGE
jgi:hypothetical protein